MGDIGPVHLRKGQVIPEQWLVAAGVFTPPTGGNP
jgi:hypothetical protein